MRDTNRVVRHYACFRVSALVHALSSDDERRRRRDRRIRTTRTNPGGKSVCSVHDSPARTPSPSQHWIEARQHVQQLLDWRLPTRCGVEVTNVWYGYDMGRPRLATGRPAREQHAAAAAISMPVVDTATASKMANRGNKVLRYDSARARLSLPLRAHTNASHWYDDRSRVKFLPVPSKGAPAIQR